jgi:hypothetical protein
MGSAPPAPLVLQFIKAVFATGPVTIELADRFQGIPGIADQHRVFPHRKVFWRIGKVEMGLTRFFVGLTFGQQATCDAPTQHNNAPGLKPARKSQGGFHSIEALSRRLPVITRPLPLDQTLDPGALAQFEGVGLPDLPTPP